MDNLKRLGLEKDKRLLTAKEYQNVFESGKKIVTTYLVAFYCENGLDFSRIGTAISKKYSVNAVQRNRIRRILKESFRHQTLLTPIDVVFTCRKGIVQCSNSELRNTLDFIWRKLNKSFVRV